MVYVSRQSGVGASSRSARSLGKAGGLAYDLNNIPLTAWTCQAMLITVPLMLAGVAIDDLAIACCVEVAIGAAAVGRHGSRGLVALVRGEGAQSKADSEAGETNRSRGQDDGVCWRSLSDRRQAVIAEVKPNRIPRVCWLRRL